MPAERLAGRRGKGYYNSFDETLSTLLHFWRRTFPAEGSKYGASAALMTGTGDGQIGGDRYLDMKVVVSSGRHIYKNTGESVTTRGP